MKITVLGCYGPYPAPGEATSGYLIECAGKKILLDCGAGVCGKLMERCSPEELDLLVFSHLHYDHMSDASVLGYYYQLHGGVLPVWLPGEEQSARRSILDVPMFALNDMKDEWELDGIRFLTVPVCHPVPCRAVRIEADGKVFAFTGDSNICPRLEDFCRGADVLFADSAFTTAQWGEGKPHMSAALCGKLAAAAGVKKLYLTHLNPGNDTEQLVREAGEYFPNVSCVYPGMTCPV